MIFTIFTDKYETVGEKLLKNYNVLRYLNVFPFCEWNTSGAKQRRWRATSHVSYSHISVVPPTPPPCMDPFLSRSGVKCPHFHFSSIASQLRSKIYQLSAKLILLFHLQDMKSSKPFAKSVEDLMVYFTSHIRSKFTSQAPSKQFHVYLTTLGRLPWKDVAADWE